MNNYEKTVEKFYVDILKYFLIVFKNLLTAIDFLCVLGLVIITCSKEILLINSDKMTTS